jgi:hypothetical protein
VFHFVWSDQAPSVTSYSTATATLTLDHDFPRDTNVSALVDMRLLLETLTTEQTRVGEWVNVVGYITSESIATKSKGARRWPKKVHIQALLLWSAGSMDLQRYEKCLSLDENEDDNDDSNASRLVDAIS